MEPDNGEIYLFSIVTKLSTFYEAKVSKCKSHVYCTFRWLVKLIFTVIRNLSNISFDLTSS